MSEKTRFPVLPDLDIVLLGKTGNGKSATGNSILWRKAFKASGQNTSVTQDVKPEYSEVKGYCIKVVDTPGLADTELSEIQDKERLVMSMSEVFRHCNIGVHVFLLVVRLNVRMTKEERDVLKTLKNIFGDSYLKDYGIVVVTHGDAFEHQMEEEGLKMSFEEWIRQSDLGPVGELFAECDYRCVLFDNRTNSEIKNQQLDKLLHYAESLRKKGIYTEGKFKEFSLKRKKMIKELKLPELKDPIERKIGLLLSNVSVLSQNLDLTGVEKAEDRAAVLLEEIKKEDEGTSLLDDLIKSVKDLRNRCQEIKRLIEENRKEEAKKEAEEMNAKAIAMEERRQSGLKKAWYATNATTLATCLGFVGFGAAIVATGPVGFTFAGATVAASAVGIAASSIFRNQGLKEASEKK